MWKNLIVLVIFFCISIPLIAQQTVTISGFVREKGSQELLPGTNVFIENSPYGTTTNTYGFYSLTVPKSDSVLITFSYVGFERISVLKSAKSNLEISIELTPVTQLNEVVISARRQEELVSESVEMSKIEVPINQIKKIPAFLGEKDVLKVLQLMPGVQKGTEGQTGLYVRGGGPDQNLIILDDAVVYNANHLFGFFSVFNGDALKSVELTKGGFPARYGGRLSSVIELNMKEGSKEKLHGEGGIGLISSRLTLEGPLAKKKSSFLISGRRTYIDALAAPLIASQNKNNESKTTAGYYFYDLNAKLNYDFGNKNKLYISGYFGQDRFKVRDWDSNDEFKTGLNWGNATATLRWNHLISPKLFVNTSLIYSNFNFNIFASEEDNIGSSSPQRFSMDYDSRIRDFSLKSDFDFYPVPAHSIKFGFQLTAHRFMPSALVVQGTFSNDDFRSQARPINSLEGGLYIEDTWQPLQALKVNGGFRLSAFQTTTKTYLRPEPRVSAALKLARNLSAKASYARMNQYVHMLSNTGLGLPTDLWVPTTDLIAPQQSSQVAFGFAKDIMNPSLTVTWESYYKSMNHIISYREGASFLSVDGDNYNEMNWEENVTDGKGWSYGTELMVHKKTGRLSGWVGYTLSWTQWKFPELNFGKTFHPRYDRRNDLSIVGIYELSKKVSLSSTWVYGTGNSLSIPVARFYTRGNIYNPDPGNMGYISYIQNEYGEKNSFVAEPYHRLDVGIQFHKKKKSHERTWEFSVYNAYNRKNPFFYDIDSETNSSGVTKNVLKRYSLFPIMPSFSYNFKF